MLEFFHASSRQVGEKIIGTPNTVDVTIGGGELGRVFYCGHGFMNAMMWAIHKHDIVDPVVMEIQVSKTELVKLDKIYHIPTMEEVKISIAP